MLLRKLVVFSIVFAILALQANCDGQESPLSLHDETNEGEGDHAHRKVATLNGHSNVGHSRERREPAKNSINLGNSPASKAEGEHAQLKVATLEEHPPQPEQAFRTVDGEVGGADLLRERREPAIDLFKSPASQAEGEHAHQPQSGLGIREADTENGGGEPAKTSIDHVKSPASQAESMQNNIFEGLTSDENKILHPRSDEVNRDKAKRAPVSQNDLEDESDDAEVGEHYGSHDGHHPFGGRGRSHDVQAFHPGLEKRMGKESDDDGHHDDESAEDQPKSADANSITGAAGGKLSTLVIKPEPPLPAMGKKLEQTVEADSFTHDKVHEKPKSKKDANAEGKGEDHENSKPFTLFTIANTDIGIDYDKLPYREKYQWKDNTAPCHSFDLKVPDELLEKSHLTLCIFRPILEFPDETKLFIMNFEPVDGKEKESDAQRVFGFVMNHQDSTVMGRISESSRLFYGEVSAYNKEEGDVAVYVIEEIALLNKLMRNNMKTLRNMLMVMHAGFHNKDSSNNKQSVYNAVVTKGASLVNFMTYTNPSDVNRNSFLLFSTNHNSYISAGEPSMKVDVSGQVHLESGSNKIEVENDGSVRLSTSVREYTFRPNGRTIVREGMRTRTLQEHEGSVAVTAYSAQQTYDCVLPTPAFQAKRKGGYICKLCLAMDSPFIEHFLVYKIQEGEAANDFLARIIDRVAWIFRSKDFDGDKRPDNIGVDFDAEPSLWTYPSVSDEELDEQSTEILFQSLEQFQFADCCLGIGFTMKKLPDNAVGKRPSASPNGPSGVCSGRTGRIASNLIIISANSLQGNFTPIDENQLIYLTANQIAGAFGANEDGAGDDLCDQFIDENKKTRHYLMWPDVLRNTTLSEQRLSTCSKNDIVRTLSTCKSSCFDIDKHPFCGNGIVEEGEECDCGSEQNCELQTCCFSRIGKRPCRKSGIGCKSGAGSINSDLSLGIMASLLLSVFGRFVIN